MQASLLGSQARACHGAYYCAAPLRGFLLRGVGGVGGVRHPCPFLYLAARAGVHPPAVRRTGIVAGHRIAPWRAEWCMEKDPACRALAPAKKRNPSRIR